MINKILSLTVSVFVFVVSQPICANAQTIENPPTNPTMRVHVYAPIVSKTPDVRALKAKLVADYSRICRDQTIAEYDTTAQFVFVRFDGVWIDQEIKAGYSVITGRPSIVLESDSPELLDDALQDNCLSVWIVENGGLIVPDEAGNLIVIWSVVE